MPGLSESESEMSQDQYESGSEDDSDASEQEDIDSNEEEDESDEEEASDDESEDMTENSFLNREAEEGSSDDEEDDEDDSESDDKGAEENESEVVEDDNEDVSSDVDVDENLINRSVSKRAEKSKDSQTKFGKSKETPKKKQEVLKPILKEQNQKKKPEISPTKKTEKESKKLSDAKISKSKYMLVRFQKAPTEDTESFLKSKCEGIINVQSAVVKARILCLVSFETSETCSEAMQKLKKIKVRGKNLRISYVKTNPEKLISELIEKNKKKLKDSNRLRNKKKTGEFQTNDKKVYATAISVENIPKTVQKEQIKEIFRSAEKIELFNKKGEETKSAFVFFPSKNRAKKARKYNIVISGNKLTLRYHLYDNQKSDESGKKNTKTKKAKTQAIENALKFAKNAKKQMKRKSETNDNAPPAKKIKNNVPRVEKGKDHPQLKNENGNLQPKTKGKLNAHTLKKEKVVDQSTQKKNKIKTEHKTHKELKEEHQLNIANKTNQKHAIEKSKKENFKGLKKFKGTANLHGNDEKVPEPSEPKVKQGSFEKKSKPMQLESTVKKNNKKNLKKIKQDEKHKNMNVPENRTEPLSKGAKIFVENNTALMKPTKKDGKLKNRLEKSITKALKTGDVQQKHENSNAKTKKENEKKSKTGHLKMKIKHK